MQSIKSLPVTDIFYKWKMSTSLFVDKNRTTINTPRTPPPHSCQPHRWAGLACITWLQSQTEKHSPVAEPSLVLKVTVRHFGIKCPPSKYNRTEAGGEHAGGTEGLPALRLLEQRLVEQRLVEQRLVEQRPVRVKLEDQRLVDQRPVRVKLGSEV